MTGPRDEETVFRSLAAPGLEEDDLFLALHGLPVPGPFWGDGRPSEPRLPGEGRWDEETQRRRRHERLLDKWGEAPGPAGAA